MQVKHSMKKPTGLAFGAVTTLGIVLLVLAVARQAGDLPAGLSGDLGLGNAGLSLAGLGVGVGTVATNDSTNAMGAQQLAASTLRERFLHGTPYEETVIDAPAAPSYRRGSSYKQGSNKAEIPADSWMAAPSSSESNGDADADAANLAVDKIRRQVEKNTTAPAVAAPAPTPPAPAALKPAAAPVVQTAQPVPEVSLQVGAFRQVESAMSLKNRLAPRFPDTWISRINSGGEALYRVRVGHFFGIEETVSLKAELLAHGFPSFRTTN